MNVTSGIHSLSRSAGTHPTEGASAGNATAVPEAGLSHDIAQLSSVGTQVAQATSLSDVRMDKVAAIQSALQAGSYEVSASDVAQKIVESMIESGK